MDQDPRLNDEALVRELEEALKVDPSPEFLARVRMRIAAGGRAGRLSWRIVTFGTVAATLVLALVVMRSGRELQVEREGPVSGPPAVEPASRGVSEVTRLLPAAPIEMPVGTIRIPAASTGRPAATLIAAGRPNSLAARATPPAVPEVVISRNEQAALGALLRSLRAGPVDPALLGTTSGEIAYLEPLDEVKIAPIAIEPIPPLALLEGERP